ncbi:class I SAM-dependent methyltransferase [Serpentinimonas maccroryi]|uniref:class I SAM-dependent methyltransferase n=1 Tax=Serpentinimonas maccroryi TaxID=1458426 RepID=UPI002033FB77|nr:class I SAM-dependent methyltransferase [Serpentinimonas maccroryi]MCM2479136.1 class I SAM-dependent methyltransferase [Serpentinimonas maccroryi]
METSLRRCGRSHCPPGAVPPECLLRQTRLQAVRATLLIPLVARAHGARCYPWLDCHDADAAHLLSCLQSDAETLLQDRLVVLNVLWRTHVLKAWGREFFARHPHAAGVNLGCGLSNHFQWFDNGHNRWLDADLPEVLALREQLLPVQGERRHNASIDMARDGWWDALELDRLAAGGPLWLLCEGVLMYLPPGRVRALLAEFAERAAPGSVLVLDAISHRGIGQAHMSPSVGPSGAEFRWGLQHSDELLQAHPRLRPWCAARSVAECYGVFGWAAEALSLPWSGAPLYSMHALRV